MTGPGGEDDDDRTRIGEPLPGGSSTPLRPEDDGDRTIFGADQPLAPPAAETTMPPTDAPVPPVSDDADRTVFGAPQPMAAPGSSPPPADADKTVFGAAPTSSPPAGGDEDRTVFGAAQPTGSERSAPANEDRTVFGETPATPPPADGTIAPGAPAPEATVAPAADPEATRAGPVPPAAAPRDARAAARSGALAVGTVINNNYRVEQVLNAGGMGRVYRGVEIGTGDPVAIKVVLPELAEDDKVGLMFKREARTLRQLQDDAIVRYYNYVHDTELDCYALVMEFISGVPLSDHVTEGGPISVEEGKTLLRRLAQGLQKAHDREVVHRDLSPDNVMLQENRISEAVIIDFGIAKSNVVKESTMAGQFAGKLKYVSPEQLGAYGGEVGPRSDIYSLSLLMAAVLVGQAVDMGSSIVEAVQKRGGVPDLSDVPEAFRPILSYMLEPDPAMRPTSMTHVIELMDDPSGIPPQHLSGLPLPNLGLPKTATQSRTTMPGFIPAAPVPGFQAPPTAKPLGDTSTPDIKRRRSGGGPGLVAGLVLIGGLIGGGGYAWYAGALPFMPPWEEVFGGQEIAGPDGDEDTTGTPEVLLNSSEGFLATYEAGECSYATRSDVGPNAGRIEGFGTDPSVFAALPEAYESRFGERPELIERPVASVQCAALDLARAFQGTSLAPVEVVLDQDRVESGSSVVGTVIDIEEREVWLVLIAPNGRIFKLGEQLGEPVSGRRSFAFTLAAPGTQPQSYLVMAVATPKPLVRGAAAQNFTEASALFPLVEREILNNEALGVVGLGYVELVPPGYEPPQPERPNDDGGPAPTDETGGEDDGNTQDGESDASVTPDALRSVITASALSPIQKALLGSLIDQAEADPALLAAAEEVVREAIAGLE